MSVEPVDRLIKAVYHASLVPKSPPGPSKRVDNTLELVGLAKEVLLAFASVPIKRQIEVISKYTLAERKLVSSYDNGKSPVSCVVLDLLGSLQSKDTLVLLSNVNAVITQQQYFPHEDAVRAVMKHHPTRLGERIQTFERSLRALGALRYAL